MKALITVGALALAGIVYLLWGFWFWIFAGIVVVLAVSVKHFLVSVPEVTGLLTVNVFTGKLTPYGTGLHFRWPWEQVKEGLYINLRLTTEEVTETYPSQDGPIMEAKWSFQYRPILEHLATYVAVDDGTIREGLREVGSAFLSAEIARLNSEECKREQRRLEENLRERFVGQMDDPRNPLTLYGVEIVRAAIADLDFESSVQAVRATEQIATKLRQIATAIRREHPEISQKDAMNMAMVIHGKIGKSIFEVEGEGGNAIAALLKMIFGGGK